MGPEDDLTPKADELVAGHPYVYEPEFPGTVEATLDDVSYAYADEDDLALNDKANKDLAQMQIPVLADQDDPNKHVFFAVFDGTMNDRHNMEEAPTGVAQIYGEIDSKVDAGWGDGRVAAAYITGTATREYDGMVDGALGYSSDDRAETMYLRFCEQAAAWRDKNPDAEISVASMGFSRGAEEAALFARLVDERGIMRPEDIAYEIREDGLVDAESVRIDPRKAEVGPGEVPQAVALVDPVPEGQLEYRDRRLPPSVVSATQITARDETRDQFAGSRHLPLGLSDDNRSLNVVVPGAHADIGDGYYANGLGVRNTNFVKNYLNTLVDFDDPMLTLKPEDARVGVGSTNIIHDSEAHKPAVYSNDGFREDGVRDVRAELNTPESPEVTPAAGRSPMGLAPPTIPEADTRREAMDTELAGSLDYRTATVAAPPAGDLYDAREAQETGCSFPSPAIEVSAPADAPPNSPYAITSELRDTMCETGRFPVAGAEPSPPLETTLEDLKIRPLEENADGEVVGRLPMTDPSHPGFSMYSEAWNAMADPKLTNIPYGSMTEYERARASAALASTAMAEGLNSIDHVVMSGKGDRLIVVQGDLMDPASKRVTVPLTAALTTPVEESTKKADAVLDEQSQRALFSPYDSSQPAVANGMRVQ